MRKKGPSEAPQHNLCKYMDIAELSPRLTGLSRLTRRTQAICQIPLFIPTGLTRARCRSGPGNISGRRGRIKRRSERAEVRGDRPERERRRKVLSVGRMVGSARHNALLSPHRGLG